jgi:hypothetical protein
MAGLVLKIQDWNPGEAMEMVALTEAHQQQLEKSILRTVAHTLRNDRDVVTIEVALSVKVMRRADINPAVDEVLDDARRLKMRTNARAKAEAEAKAEVDQDRTGWCVACRSGLHTECGAQVRASGTNCACPKCWGPNSTPGDDPPTPKEGS